MPIPLVTRILIADDHPIVRSGVRMIPKGIMEEADIARAAELAAQADASFD